MAERQSIITIQARGYVIQAGYAHTERALDNCALLYNAALRWRDLLDVEDGAGLIYIERSKTDQTGEGAYVVVTPDTLAALKQLRQDSETWTDDDLVFGLSMSQISRRVDSMARRSTASRRPSNSTRPVLTTIWGENCRMQASGTMKW